MKNLLKILQESESFISGFENAKEEGQDVSELLKDLRHQIATIEKKEKLSFEQMMVKIQNRFPSATVLDGSNFSKDIEPSTSFWIKNCETVTYTDKDKNTLYLANDYENKSYELEVYKKFEKWCNRFGWYASTESYTLQIFKL